MWNLRLKQLRKENKLSQDKLAESLGLTREAYGKYERGERFPDDINIVINTANYFKVSVDYILGVSEIRNPYLYVGFLVTCSLEEQNIIEIVIEGLKARRK